MSRKAFVQGMRGSPDRLELREIEKPLLGDDELLVRVRGASVNPADWHAMRGKPFVVRLAGFGLRKPKNPVLGIDVAGVVEAVGKSVERDWGGDRRCRGGCIPAPRSSSDFEANPIAVG